MALGEIKISPATMKRFKENFLDNLDLEAAIVGGMTLNEIVAQNEAEPL